VPDAPRLQTLIEEAALRFATEIVDTLRAATVNDIVDMTGGKVAQPKRRGRPPKAKVAEASPVADAVEAAPVVASEAPVEPTKPVKKKRNWPKCSVEGCDANFYAPSGSPRLCYAHHMEAGGEASPLVKAQQKKAAAKPAVAKQPAKAKAPSVEAEPAPEPAAAEPAPEKKKRAWPQCSAEGCTKNMYGPSGQAKLCYQHHREAGGAASVLLGVKKKKAEKVEAPKAVAVEPESLLDPEPADEARPKKKRAWPKCSAEGCDKNVYMPSGAAKLCYSHHVEQGGSVSPLVKHNKAKSEPEPEPAPKKPAEKKTILRKKS
jgi:hypothetical protein